MAFRWCESFEDLYAIGDFTTRYPLSGNAHEPNSGGRFGRGLWGVGIGAFKISLDTQATWIVGCAVKFGSLGGHNPIIALSDNGSLQIEVRMNGSGGFDVTRNGTVLTSVAGPLFPTNAWQYLELKATIHNTTGSFTLRLNGATIASQSGVNTRATANNWANFIEFHATSGRNVYWDDVYVFDATGASENDFAGDSKVNCLLVGGAGSYTAFTPAAGANFQNVDELWQDFDATYNHSNSPGAIDTYALQDTVFTGGIRGLIVHGYMRKDDAGAREVALYTKSGATETQGPTVALGNNYQCYSNVLWKDPNTGALWTPAGVNALEAGAKVIT